MDGTLIQVWASHKSFVPKDNDAGEDSDAGDPDAGDGSHFRGSSRSNASHATKTDPDSRLYRKGKTASQLYFMGHTLMENRHGLIVDAMVTRANGKAEREAAKAMIGKVAAQSKCKANITLGADRGVDAAEFIEYLQQLKVQPHVAQNTPRRRSAVPVHIAQSAGYGLSMQCRKRIGTIWQVMVHGLQKVQQLFVLNMAAYNLVRMRRLARLCQQSAQ